MEPLERYSNDLLAVRAIADSPSRLHFQLTISILGTWPVAVERILPSGGQWRHRLSRGDRCTREACEGKSALYRCRLRFVGGALEALEPYRTPRFPRS